LAAAASVQPVDAASEPSTHWLDADGKYEANETDVCSESTSQSTPVESSSCRRRASPPDDCTRLRLRRRPRSSMMPCSAALMGAQVDATKEAGAPVTLRRALAPSMRVVKSASLERSMVACVVSIDASSAYEARASS